MPTTVHIPKPLLAAADRRARALRISRNKLIVQALERELAEAGQWSAVFLDRLRDVKPGTAAAVGHLRDAVLAARRSKKPPQL